MQSDFKTESLEKTGENLGKFSPDKLMKDAKDYQKKAMVWAKENPRIVIPAVVATGLVVGMVVKRAISAKTSAKK